MTIQIPLRTVPLSGSYTPAGDKSLSHRALLFAALAEGESTIHHFLHSGVTKAMLNVLSALGVKWHLDTATQTLTVTGVGLHGLKAPAEPLYCGNSATTFRLVAGVLASAGISCTLTGSDGLCRRPMTRITAPLKAMGAEIIDTEGCAPLFFSPATLRGIHYALPIASAQVKSCLILAALNATSEATFTEPGPSRDHTERMLMAMGAQLDVGHQCVTIHPQKTPLKPLNTTLAGDISSAAFLMVAALLVPGSQFILRQVCINPTRTGICDALRAMGATITFQNDSTIAGEPVADICVTASHLKGIEIKGDLVVRMIDEFPVFMIAAAAAEGVTIVHDAAELRAKESDRIAIMTEELRRQGVEIEEYPDGFKITGTGKIPGGAVAQGHGDHRVAMSLSIAGLIAQAPIQLEEAEIIQESFPDFLTVLGIQ